MTDIVSVLEVTARHCRHFRVNDRVFFDSVDVLEITTELWQALSVF
jgi:hypothetical protein